MAMPVPGQIILVCPLCGFKDAPAFWRDTRRDYLRCRRCNLVFVPSVQHLGSAEELAEYRLHRNDPEDPGYRRFLSRLATPLLQKLPPYSRGLDFGCGPGPALARILTEAGHHVALYDPFFAPDKSVLDVMYDFVTASEVVEHLRQPRKDLDKLWAVLRPGGWLGIMTKLALDVEAFSRWHYKNDPTHILFFSRSTFAWLANRWQAHLEFVDKDVILLRKPFIASP